MPEDRNQPSPNEREGTLRCGDLLSHYRVERLIGRGGSGAVYLATDTHLEREIVLKVLAPDIMNQPQARKRFRREAHALSRLNHPDIATVYDFDTQQGIDFLAMELVQGETLAARLKNGPMREERVREIGAKVCAALADAHSHGVLHRDLSPQNIMIGDRGAVKVLDFGLAKILSAEPETLGPTATMEVTQHIAGTVPYISPERLRGESADERADLYALGAILYEMATGTRVFSGRTPAELAAATLNDPAPSILESRNDVSTSLALLIERALQKDPADRHQTAQEMLEDLAPWQSGTTTGSRLGENRSSTWLWWALAAVVGFSLAGTFWHQNSREPGVGNLSFSALVTGPEQESESRISPDGRWISYQTSGLGESTIWLLPSTGGEPRRVTKTPGDLEGHVWSPDGEQIAFAYQSEETPLLQTIPSFGGPVNLSVVLPEFSTVVRTVRWVDDEVYLDTGIQGLWKVNLVTSKAEKVLSEMGSEGFRFEFDVCEDAHRAVYTVREANRFALWVVDLPDGKPHRLTRHDASDLRGKWTGPNCGAVLHASNQTRQSDLWKTDLDGHGTNLTYGGAVEYAESGSHDGSVLTYRQERTAGNLWVLDPRGDSPRVRLTADTREDFWPTASGDGSRVAFQRRAPDVEEFDPVFESQILAGRLVEGELSDVRTVSRRGGLAGLSYDGRWLAHVRPVDGQHYELVLTDLATDRSEVMDADPSLPTLGFTPLGPLWNDLLWSRRESRLFYVKRAGHSTELRSIVAGFDNEPQVHVVCKEGSLRQPIESLDGRSVVYLRATTSSASGNSASIEMQLRCLTLDSGKEEILHSGGSDENGLWRIVGQRDDESWVLLLNQGRVPGAASAALIVIGKDGSTSTLREFDGHLSYCVLDPVTQRFFVTLTPEGERAQNLFVFDPETGKMDRLSANTLESTLYSHPALLPSGRLLYTEQEHDTDIWLVRFEP